MNAIGHDSDAKAPFVIFGRARTGSTLLFTLLNSHPQVTCFAEPFHPRKIYIKLDGLSAEEIARLRDADPIAFADRLLDMADSRQVRGFKILSYQDKAVQEHVLRRRDVRKIFLYRRNLLAAFSSEKIARDTGQWHAREGDTVDARRIVFDGDEFARFVRNSDRYYARIETMARESGSSFIYLEYNELNNLYIHKVLLNYLGVDSDKTLSTKLIKQNPSNLRRRFVNWDKVVACLEGSAQEPWLAGE